MKHSIVIIPTFNEKDHIQPLVDAITPLGINILFVDDNSPDHTAQTIESLQHTHPHGSHIHLLKRPKKMGLGSAYRDGFKWVLTQPFDFILQMDADFSHDPHVLGKMIELLHTHDMILGSRYIPLGKTLGWPFHRLLLSRLANIYAQKILSSPIHDLTGGFKAYRRTVLQKIVHSPIGAEGYAFQIQTTTAAIRHGFSVVEIPITFKDREIGKSKLSRKVVWEAFFAVIRLRFGR